MDCHCFSLDLPAGHTIRFLVGFTNKGEKTFTVQSLECSFRYPQDYNFFIQNVSEYTNSITSKMHKELLQNEMISQVNLNVKHEFGVLISSTQQLSTTRMWGQENKLHLNMDLPPMKASLVDPLACPSCWITRTR